MNTSIRHTVVAGGISGLVAGLVPALSLDVNSPGTMSVGPAGWGAVSVALQLVLAMLGGAGFGALVRDQLDGRAATAASGLLYGLLWWIVGPLTVAPMAHGHIPTWSLRDATATFPALIASLFYGGVLGGVLPLLTGTFGNPRASARCEPVVRPVRRIVILGGGFGGVSVAQRLEFLLARDPSVQITMVSQSNYLLFTPMLAEVAASGLEPQHISAPVRAAFLRVEFRHAELETVNVAARLVRTRAAGAARIDALHYDHLVLALGAVPNLRRVPGLEAHAFTLKSLDDANRLRNHVIGLLERADVEVDPHERRRQLTFVVVGGGFAGAEMIAELRDLVHSVRRFYRGIDPGALRFVLVHSGERILPELGSALAAYARRKMEARGIEFLLGARMAAAHSDSVVLADGRTVPTRTIVWAAGNQPHPLLRSLPVERSQSGAVIVEPTLQVKGLPNVWAVGDCAQIPDAFHEGSSCPPTAQHAVREGIAVAENIVAVLRGIAPRPFRFRTIATLVALGHRTAVADVRGWRFSGFLAWAMWRTVYWWKLPGLEKKIRVALDWTIDLFFPRDVALLTASPSVPQGLDAPEPGRGASSVPTPAAPPPPAT